MGHRLLPSCVVLALIVWTVRDPGSEPVHQAQTASVDTGRCDRVGVRQRECRRRHDRQRRLPGHRWRGHQDPGQARSEGRQGTGAGTVDATSARAGRGQGSVQLESAQASYADHRPGPDLRGVPARRRSIDQSQASVASARSSLARRKQSGADQQPAERGRRARAEARRATPLRDETRSSQPRRLR